MDATAITLCMDKKLPIVVFDMFTQGNLEKLLQGVVNLGFGTLSGH